MHDTNPVSVSPNRRTAGRAAVREPLQRSIERAIEISVMSFNIRNSAACDGAYAWPSRRELAMQVVRDGEPDLIGFQEVLADQYDDLTGNLDRYAFTGVGRDDGDRAGERALIGFRRDRFSLVETGHFWLAEDHDRPQFGWDAACIRICSWARLHDLVADRPLLLANTHWDHEGTLARERSAMLMRQKLAAHAAGAAAVVTGDFNSHETDPWMHHLLQPTLGELHLADSYRIAHPQRLADERTDHHFTDRTDGMRIDYILHSPQLHTVSAAIIRTRGADGMYPADHFPVCARLAWRNDGGEA